MNSLLQLASEVEDFEDGDMLEGSDDGVADIAQHDLAAVEGNVHRRLEAGRERRLRSERASVVNEDLL